MQVSSQRTPRTEQLEDIEEKRPVLIPLPTKPTPVSVTLVLTPPRPPDVAPLTLGPVDAGGDVTLRGPSDDSAALRHPFRRRDRQGRVGGTGPRDLDRTRTSEVEKES